MTTTPNLNLNLPDFNKSPWHDDVNDNFRSIDATIKSIFGIDNLKGTYKNSTAVTSGERYFDSSTGYYYEAQSDFTTLASPNTFAQERTAYTDRWELLDAAAAIDAALNAAASATQAASSATTASTSATNASASATTATTKASEASASASNAAASATNAATSATNAAASAVTAANNAASVDLSTALLKADNLAGLTNVTTAKTNLMLNNVDNTSDANKPVSTAQQSAIDAVSSSVTALDNSLGTLAYLDKVSGDQVGTLTNDLHIEKEWPGLQLKPTVPGGFGYIDFVKHDRPNQDFQFRLRSDPTSEQMLFEHFDSNDVYSNTHLLTGDGNIWTKSYGWLHEKFAAKDEVSAWEHIQTISTNTPVLDFTFQNLSQFRALRLTFDVRPDTDQAQLWLRTSRDNGANFDAGASDYDYVQHYAWQAGQGYGGGYSSTAFVLAANLGNASSAYRVAGELQLTELNKPKRTYMKGEYFNLNRSPDLVSYGFGGLNAHAEANDAIRIFFNAGQIAEGYVTLEGIKG